MTAKDVVEALLYINPDTYNSFRAAHIINDLDRNWKAKEHSEYPFISKFTNPYFLIIIEKQIHVYIIGEKFKEKSYNILNIEGYNADHMIMTKGELIDNISKTIKEKVYLPPNFSERIIFIKNNKLFVFNKVTFKGNIFSKAAYWSIGTDIYSVDNPTYKLSAYDILKEINKEF